MQLQNYVCIFHLQKANLKDTYWQFHSQAQKKQSKNKTKQNEKQKQQQQRTK